MKVSCFLNYIIVITAKHAGLGIGTIYPMYVSQNLMEVC